MADPRKCKQINITECLSKIDDDEELICFLNEMSSISDELNINNIQQLIARFFLLIKSQFDDNGINRILQFCQKTLENKASILSQTLKNDAVIYKLPTKVFNHLQCYL